MVCFSRKTLCVFGAMATATTSKALHVTDTKSDLTCG